MASKWKGTYDSGRKYNKAWEGKFILAHESFGQQ